MDTQQFFDENKLLLTKEEINLLPAISYEGEIVLVRSDEELDLAVNELKKNSVLGFDTETRPRFTKGAMHLPSLIQLATDKKVYIIQLKHIGNTEKLAELLSDEQIIKAGVAIHEDYRSLARLFPLESNGLVDLAKLANQKGMKAQGLRTISANLLGYKISKGAQCSNWAADTLNHSQILYAATDAWLGLILYNQLARLADSPNYQPETPKKKKKKKFRFFNKKNMEKETIEEIKD